MDKNINDRIDLSLESEELFRQYGRKKTVALFTLGCKVNQYETEAVSEIFEKEGYEVIDFQEKADVYVINTCTVTNLSDRKSRQIIKRAKKTNEDAIVIVMGCYAQTAPQEVESIPGVNLVMGTKERGRIIDYINEIKANSNDTINAVSNIMLSRDFEELNIESYKERTRAFLKIQEGCNQFCSYCIIPYARGPIRSRSPEGIIKEVKKLATYGFKEVVLTGIHLASYGKDINSFQDKERNITILDIIKMIHEIEGIERIRLGSLEPSTITEEFVNEAGQLRKLCPHYHISLQSGCDETLKRMNRRYNTDYFRWAVKHLRDNIKDVAITTDVMVGFPGETEEEFQKTYGFLKKINFSDMHVFKFSPRKGTHAATYKDQVTYEKKEERSNLVLSLAKENAFRFNKSFLGRTMPVLIEKETNKDSDLFEGHTANYIKVLCEGKENLRGKIAAVILEKAEDDYILGHITDKY
jgi:threonylcarbamoyladenosine tRNA methylthiotransferase MtaB